MEKTPPSKLLIEQHRQLDAQLLNLQTGAYSPTLLANTIHQLKRHIYIEEELLFPLVNSRALKMPLAVMRDEHGQMWQLMQQLSACHATQADATAPNQHCLALCQQLFQLLELHNPKEEEIIYSALDVYNANDVEPGSLAEDIANAKLPANWVCAAHQHGG